LALEIAERAALADMGSYEAAWKSARACAELLDATWDDRARDERITLAQRGVNHAERGKELAPEGPEAPYWAAACYGLLGKAKGLGGKKTLDPILENCRKVVALDPRYDGAGAHRILGAVYLKAPAWPASIGHLDRSREELERACALAPERPENHLLLARVLVEIDDPASNAAAGEALERFRLLSPADEASWPRFWREEMAAIREKRK